MPGVEFWPTGSPGVDREHRVFRDLDCCRKALAQSARADIIGAAAFCPIGGASPRFNARHRQIRPMRAIGGRICAECWKKLAIIEVLGLQRVSRFCKSDSRHGDPMFMSETRPDSNVIEMTAEIVSAYVRNNSVPAGELPALLQSVHESLGTIVSGAKPEAVKEPLQPKVPIKKSVTTDYIICLEDGKRFKSLKRHLYSAYGLTPQEYRTKWSLPKDYPMVAPAYASARSNLAKTMGLGRKSAAVAVEAPEPVVAAKPPVSEPDNEAPVKRRGRRPKAA